MKDLIQKVASHLAADRRIVVLTGAGISAESGIPTFRDPSEGLWARFRPEELASVEGFQKDPKLVMDWYFWRREKVLASKPNAGHQVLASWAQKFPGFTLITQNVDGLHEQAGSRNAIEMHGNIHRLRCFNKGHRGSWPLNGLPANCAECGSLMRPDIVWFGESLDPENLKKISHALQTCDIFLAIGTSGLVYPAAGYLQAVARLGKPTVVINKDPASDPGANFFINAPASEALLAIDSCLINS